MCLLLQICEPEQKVKEQTIGQDNIYKLRLVGMKLSVEGQSMTFYNFPYTQIKLIINQLNCKTSVINLNSDQLKVVTCYRFFYKENNVLCHISSTHADLSSI